MMLIMVLLRLGHRVQKLLAVPIGSTSQTYPLHLCYALLLNPYVQLKVCHSSDCFQDILQAKQTPDGALIKIPNCSLLAFQSTKVQLAGGQQSRLNIDNLQATVVPQKLQPEKTFGGGLGGATEPKQHSKSKPASPHG